jgi:SPP1 family predicted phage head-tail adaptor
MPGPLGKRGTTIGRLRNRLKLQTLPAVPDRDASGQEIESWSDQVALIWGEVTAVQDREVFVSGQVQAQGTHRVRVRYRTDVTEKKRLVWLDGGNAVLNIVAVLPSVGLANCLDVWCIQDKQE